jgi:hypothetical protein
LTARARAREQAVAFTGTRPLSEMLEQNRVMRAAKAASLAEPASCLYASGPGGQVTELPITRHTPKQIHFGKGHYVSRAHIETEGCACVHGWPTGEWMWVYATRGLAEALAGEPLPRVPDHDWRDEHDKARDHRSEIRIGYAMYHVHADRLREWNPWDGDVAFLTEDEAQTIHDRIDAAIKADGYWDDDLPAQWWRAR